VLPGGVLENASEDCESYKYGYETYRVPRGGKQWPGGWARNRFGGHCASLILFYDPSSPKVTKN
jgi:hypothetical protein